MVNVGRSPDSASMCFYDRTADGQSHADSAGLGGEKWLKKLIQLVGGDSLAGITNRNNDVVQVPRGAKRESISSNVPPAHPWLGWHSTPD